jgi:two-component system sensor histidine kinase BaeS
MGEHRFLSGPPRWRGRPPWWPENEPFPPQGPDGWRNVRGRFARRVAAFLLVILALALLAGGALFWAGTRIGANHPQGWHYFPFGTGLTLFVVVAIVAVLRGARRTAQPVGDVMDAAGRVAAGDYSARVAPRGTREVRELGRSFNAMAERLEADERVRRQLFADVAHELRTPMTVVRANVEGVLDGLYPADAEHLEPVLEEVKVMSRLLEDLSTLAMTEAGAIPLHREPTDPVVLAEEVVAAHAPEARAAAVALAVRGDEAVPSASIDPVRIREVLSNLIANALRYTPAGGSITVGIASEAPSADGSPMVAFRVADTGPGIPSERLEHVFDRFSRSPDSRGAGLGLAIAKGLVEAHGGSIDVASDGGGTVFTLVLPTHPPGSGADGGVG